MARRKHIPARKIEISESKKKNSHRSHFDFMNATFAEEHYGLYLIVKNTHKDDPQHNRLYLCHKEYSQFHEKCKFAANNNSTSTTKGAYQLLDVFPKHSDLINKFCSYIPEFAKRYAIRRYLNGLSKAIIYLEKQKLEIPDDPLKFTVVHNKVLTDGILNGKFRKEDSRQLSVAWKHIRDVIGNQRLSKLPTKPSPEIELQNMVQSQKNQTTLELPYQKEDDNEKDISIEVLFQLDYYAQIELERIICRRQEYLEWMNELDKLNKNGGLFTQSNLLKTYYSNLSWDNLRRFYIYKFGEDPLVWIPKAVRYKKNNGCQQKLKVYPNKQAEDRHVKLQKIAEQGISLTMQSEKMLAWWINTIMPNYPYDRTIAKEYQLLVNGGKQWYGNALTSLNIESEDFLTRCIVTRDVIYPLYLLMLIRYEINQEPLSNAEVYWKKNKYELGGDQFDARYIGTTTIKTRSNAIIPIVVQKESPEDKYISFYLKWMAPIFKRSKLKAFFQYFDQKHKSYLVIDSKKITRMRPSLLKKKAIFFQRYEIFDTIEEQSDIEDKTKLGKKRIEWIEHYRIRAAGNYARYVQRYNQYVRSLELKHRNESTEKINYRNKEFRWMTGHQLGLTQAILINHVTGIERNKRLDEFFQTPLANCSNPRSPTYKNAPQIKDNEICTAWWHCLVGCEHGNINPLINGPYIMAFKKVLEELKKEMSFRIQDWEKEFRAPYEATKFYLKQFTHEELIHCEFNYTKCLKFIRNLMNFRHLKMKI